MGTKRHLVEFVGGAMHGQQRESTYLSRFIEIPGFMPSGAFGAQRYERGETVGGVTFYSVYCAASVR